MESPQSQNLSAHWDHEPALPCGAELYSAVSRIFNPLSASDAPELSTALPSATRRYSRLKTCATGMRFMESPQSQKMVAHWDHEPIWEGRRAAEPIRGTATRGPSRRFMESPLSIFRMHWDLEPLGSVGRRVPRSRSGIVNDPIGSVRIPRPTHRFMESNRGSIFRRPPSNRTLRMKTPSGHTATDAVLIPGQASPDASEIHGPTRRQPPAARGV